MSIAAQESVTLLQNPAAGPNRLHRLSILRQRVLAQGPAEYGPLLARSQQLHAFVLHNHCVAFSRRAATTPLHAQMLFAPTLRAHILSIVHQGHLVVHEVSPKGNPLSAAVIAIQSRGDQQAVVFHELIAFLQGFEARLNCIPRRCGSLLRKRAKVSASAYPLLTPPQNLLYMLPVNDHHRRRPQCIRPARFRLIT